MPYAHDAPSYPASRDAAVVHAATAYSSGEPDDAGNHDLGVRPSPMENNRGIERDLLNPAADRTLSDRNSATQGGLPFKRSLQSISIRARVSSTDMLGDVAPEEFREYDAAATFRLPWGWYSQSGWGAGMRLMASAGVLYGAGETALVVSLIPLVTFGSQDGRFTVDMGAGGALLSRHQFGMQDYGGYFQFALTAGIGIPLFKRLGAGYRFLHYSDAAIYGPHNTGADFHMLELIYRF